MAQNRTSTAELPRHPVGEGATAERIFAQAADELSAKRTAPTADPLPDATTRHLGGDGRGDFGSRLRMEVQRAQLRGESSRR